jgi:hypothetical protein
VSTFDFSDAGAWAGRGLVQRVMDARPRDRLVVRGMIRTTGKRVTGETTAFTCVLDDGTGEVDLVFLGRPFVPGLGVGVTCTIEGTARVESGRLEIWNPFYRIEPPPVPWPESN